MDVDAHKGVRHRLLENGSVHFAEDTCRRRADNMRTAYLYSGRSCDLQVVSLHPSPDLG